MKLAPVRLAAAVLVIAAVTACAGGELRVDGVVVDVQGGLASGVSAFTIVTHEGTRIEFEPIAGLTFVGGGPLSHLHEHLQTGSAVRVTYRLDAGVNLALLISDAP